NSRMLPQPPTMLWPNSSARLSGSISFCIYLAEDEAAVKEHANLSGFPATKVTKVRTVIG
ncbi:MAG: nickel-binding protein, partial [Pseudolabrys sp.]